MGGKKYYVGDYVVCTYTLKSPEVLINYQGYVTYDSDYLKIDSVVFSETAKVGSMRNTKNTGKIKFLGSNISEGYDYTSGGTFFTVTYQVLKSGSSTPTFNWEVAQGFTSGKDYVTNGKASSGLTISATYS